MTHESKHLPEFTSPLDGPGRLPILDKVGIADKSFGLIGRQLKQSFLDNFAPGKGLGLMFDRRGPFQGSFDADMAATLEEFRSHNITPNDPNYDPRGDMRFARLPEHMWEYADEAQSYTEGTIILRMLQGVMDKKRRIQESGPLGVGGSVLGLVAGEAPILLATGPLAIATVFPLVTSINEGFNQYADPTRTAEESALHITTSATFGLGFAALHKLLSASRLSPDQATAYAKRMDDEMNAQEPPRGRTFEEMMDDPNVPFEAKMTAMKNNPDNPLSFFDDEGNIVRTGASESRGGDGPAPVIPEHAGKTREEVLKVPREKTTESKSNAEHARTDRIDSEQLVGRATFNFERALRKAIGQFQFHALSIKKVQESIKKGGSFELGKLVKKDLKTAFLNFDSLSEGNLKIIFSVLKDPAIVNKMANEFERLTRIISSPKSSAAERQAAAKSHADLFRQNETFFDAMYSKDVNARLLFDLDDIAKGAVIHSRRLNTRSRLLPEEIEADVIASRGEAGSVHTGASESRSGNDIVDVIQKAVTHELTPEVEALRAIDPKLTSAAAKEMQIRASNMMREMRKALDDVDAATNQKELDLAVSKAKLELKTLQSRNQDLLDAARVEHDLNLWENRHVTDPLIPKYSGSKESKLALRNIDQRFIATNLYNSAIRLLNNFKLPTHRKPGADFAAARGGRTTADILDEVIEVNDKAGARAAVDKFVADGAIDAKQADSINSVIDIMPENFFRQAAFGAEKEHLLHRDTINVRGMYFYFEDVAAVFGDAMKGRKAGIFRPALAEKPAGEVFAHEVGHRIFFTMATEAELQQARHIFDSFRTKASTAESLKFYPNRNDHFSEWWAFEWQDYWMRRVLEGPDAALTFLEKAYAKDAIEMANVFERIIIKIVEMTRALQGRAGFEATQAMMLDAFFGTLSKRIGKEKADQILEDIANRGFSRAVRFTDGTDFLSATKQGVSSDSLSIGFSPNLSGASYSRVTKGKPFERGYVPRDDANKLLPAWFLEKLPDGPAKRLLQGDSPFARHILSYLVEHPFYQRKNVTDGVTPHGVDRNLAVEWIAPMVEALKGTDGLYNAYRQRYFNETKGMESKATPHDSSIVQLADDTIRGRGGALTRTEFMQQIGRAKIRTTGGAVEAGLEPEAIQAAKVWSEKLYGRAGQEAQDLRVFSIRQDRRRNLLEEKLQKLYDDTDNSRGMTVKQLRYAESLEQQIKQLRAEGDAANTFKLDPNYMNRIYNKTKIAANRQAFINILVKEGGYSPAEAAARTDTILTGKAFEPIEADATGMARSLKERQINIDSVHIEDYLEMNIASVGRYYATRMGADIELTRAFGSIDMKEVVAKIAVEYDNMIAKIEPGWFKKLEDHELAMKRLDNQIDKSSAIPPKPHTKEGKKLLKAKEQAMEDTRAIRDRIRGTYGIPDDPSSWTHRGIRVAKMFNAVTLLTGALSATPDLGKLIMADGLKRTIGPILEAYKSDLGMLKTMKLAKNEANLAGEAYDMYISMRSALFADLADSLSAATPFERSAGHATQQFFNISLMNQWNEGVKTLASLTAGSRMIIEAENLLKGTISKTERTKLNNIGITPEVAKHIVEQTKKHGLTGEKGHVRIAKTELWDAEAREAAGIYTRALGKEINRIIVTPGKGDTPLFMSVPLWTLIFQFKTFEIAATQRTLVPGLQLRDQNFLTGAIALVGLGAMVNEIRRYQLGITREQKFGEWLTASVERGGLVGVVSGLNGALETLSDNRIGLRPLLGAARPYTSKTAVASTLGGPIVQQAANAARVIWDIGPGDADSRTADATRRLLYGGKMFWADSLYDTVEDGAAALLE